LLKNIYRGKFIVIEGLDGSGKTTQSKLLAKFLKENGYKVLLTKEPTKTSPVSNVIREALEKRRIISSRELQELFAKDREWHLENVIVPALKEGIFVISDRYVFSSFAYGGLDINLRYLIKINRKALLPDLTIFLDVKPDLCLKRIEGRGRCRTIFEELEILKMVQENFKKIKNIFPNIVEINGEEDINFVRMEIINVVQEFLNYGQYPNNYLRSESEDKV
jgi:dTMP kinase